jgi:hypothetical protein
MDIHLLGQRLEIAARLGLVVRNDRSYIRAESEELQLGYEPGDPGVLSPRPICPL